MFTFRNISCRILLKYADFPNLACRHRFPEKHFDQNFKSLQKSIKVTAQNMKNSKSIDFSVRQFFMFS